MTDAERAEVMVRMTFGPNNGIGFSPDRALLAANMPRHQARPASEKRAPYRAL